MTIEITPSQPRQDVLVHLADGRTFHGPVGARLEGFIKAAYPAVEPPIVAAMVDDDIRELTYPIEHDAHVTPLDITNGDGIRIYQRSLSFVLVVAAHELFPEAQIVIDHSLTLNGLYCEVQGRAPFTAQEVRQLEQRMREIIAEDAPIAKALVPLKQATEVFQSQGYGEQLRLLTYRTKDYLVLYELHGLRDYFYGYMVPSTGYLRRFALRHYPPGLILRFPRRSEPTQLPPFHDSPKLASVFREYRDSLELMDVRYVSALNQVIADGHVREAILINEALHEQKISDMAQAIASRRGQVRLVLIAGPSASGKTTSSKRLAIQLLAQGIRPIAVGMDDYFLDRELTPRDKQGHPLFEDLVALDLELFNQQLLDLMAGREVKLARYNFITGKREWGDRVRISPEHVILVEGIHGMNPNLVPHVPREAVYRIYISCLTQLNIDPHNRIPTTDTRLLRRMVRDARTRGYSAQQTIRQWEHVRAGEERNIFPYQENADVMFNSALAYELAVLKPLAEPLLREIEHGTVEYAEARRLLTFLQWISSSGAEMVPDNSLLREFVGGSILEDFEPWHKGMVVEEG